MKKAVLKNHPYAQCYVTTDAEGVHLTSYCTHVCSVSHDGKRALCTGTYSPATSRQITWFLREYFPDLSLNTMRSIARKGWVNI